jgi:hypothetical protein
LGRRRDSTLDAYWIIASSSAPTATRTEPCWFRLAEVCRAQVAVQKTGCMCRPPLSPSSGTMMSKGYSSESRSTSTSTSLSMRSSSRQTERWFNGRQPLPSLISPFFSGARERSHHMVTLLFLDTTASRGNITLPSLASNERTLGGMSATQDWAYGRERPCPSDDHAHAESLARGNAEL